MLKKDISLITLDITPVIHSFSESEDYNSN